MRHCNAVVHSSTIDILHVLIVSPVTCRACTQRHKWHFVCAACVISHLSDVTVSVWLFDHWWRFIC